MAPGLPDSPHQPLNQRKTTSPFVQHCCQVYLSRLAGVCFDCYNDILKIALSILPENLISRRQYLTASPMGALLSLLSSSLYVPALIHYSLFHFAVATVLMIAHFSILYAAASRWQQTDLGEWFRGSMVGLNAGLNGILIYLITRDLYIAGTVMTVLTAGASLVISRNRIYHILLGWLNWFLPMSWLVTGLGMLIFLVNMTLAPLGFLLGIRRLRLRLGVHPTSSSIIMYGGMIRPLMQFNGFNMGNFIFINPGRENLLIHEIGHLFSLSVMGWLFHYIGGLDEGFLQADSREALAEYLADSYSNPTESVLSMWR
jgi:hypothetical protein